METLKLYKVTFNQEKQQTEPGELVWEVPCSIEVADNGWLKILPESEMEIPVGKWYLAFTLSENELHAVFCPVTDSIICSGVGVKME